jgi:hypothetical protein
MNRSMAGETEDGGNVVMFRLLFEDPNSRAGRDDDGSAAVGEAPGKAFVASGTPAF